MRNIKYNINSLFQLRVGTNLISGNYLEKKKLILRKMQSSESDMSAHLQKNFNPNKHIGPSPSNDTPLIYAVRLTFEHKLFLNECLRFGGDPFVTNANGRTAFHVACASSRSSQRTDKKRKELLHMLLDQSVK